MESALGEGHQGSRELSAQFVCVDFPGSEISLRAQHFYFSIVSIVAFAVVAAAVLVVVSGGSSGSSSPALALYY